MGKGEIKFECKMSIKKYIKQYPLVTFCFIHMCVWSLLPLLRNGVPMDSLEAIWWGKYCFWGTNKHPPLSGFPAYGIYLLFSENTKAVYFLSQICILVGFIYLYKLALKILNQHRTAVLSVMVLEGCVFYGYCSPEYNVNVMSLAIWPICAYYFYSAIIENKLKWWVFAATACGLNILNKYTGVLQLLGFSLLMMFTEEGRKCLKSYKAYVGLLVFILIIIPHLYWLLEHNFFVFEYFSTRGGKDVLASWTDHFVYPSKFLASLFFYSLGCVLLAVLFFKQKIKYQLNIQIFQSKFLFYTGICPIIFVFIGGLISGTPIKSMWGFPFLYLLGIILFSGVRENISEDVYIKMQKACYLLMFIMGIAYSLSVLFSNSPKYNLNGEQFAKSFTRKWYYHQGDSLKYVFGDVWLSSILALESIDKPKPVIWGKPHSNPWFNKADIKAYGGIIFAESLKEYAEYTENYTKVSEPQIIKFKFSNILGKSREKRYYYGFIEGE